MLGRGARGAAWVVALVLVGAGPVAGQSAGDDGAFPDRVGPVGSDPVAAGAWRAAVPADASGLRLTGPLLETTGPYVVVHLAENRVFLLEEDHVLWSAPAGTGTGFRLDGSERDWTFETPRGLFKVRRKEKDPLWEPPDWWYVERGRAVPDADEPRRLLEGVMGTTALLLGDGIAIHGTSQPELILTPDPEDRRVSHGCIRLTNEAARALFHRVEVGTPVLVY